jgi:hypothetical protein
MIEQLNVGVPHNGWLPRPHQKALWNYLMKGGKRAVAIWHRRAGKDEICLHHTAVSMLERPGNYWSCLPEYGQGRKALWTAVNPHSGKRRIDEVFPELLRESTNDHEMFIRFRNGSTWQIVGSDRYDQTVGAGVAGITFSEYALSNPSAWGYYRPMVEENNGWAAFITTPRGRNHAFEIYRHACSAKGWFAEKLTAVDTKTLTEGQLAEALAEYEALYGRDVGRAHFEQEYMVSFNAAILGAFYGLEMADVRNESRIVPIEALPGIPVHRSWDLGTRDDTSIWWYQQVGAQLYILDHYAASGAGVEHYAEVIEQRRNLHGWRDGNDYVPHDAKVMEWGSGRTRVETMIEHGLHPMPIPRVSFDDGINAARQTLPLCVFHPRCEEGGISALEQYHREWDEEKKAFRANATHDWTSHPADSFRYLSLSWRPLPPRKLRVNGPMTGDTGWRIPPVREYNERWRGGIEL